VDTLQRILEIFNLTLPTDGQKPPFPVPGNRDRLAQLFAELNLNVGAEIGVERGAYTKVLAAANPHLKLYAIDAWQHYRGYRDHVNQTQLNEFYTQTKDMLKPFKNVEIIKGWSTDVALDFPHGSLDFVYVDANHGFDYVMEDLITWGRRVRSGGIIAGHDFARYRGVWVVQAASMYTYGNGIGTWFTTTEDSPNRNRGEARSFFMVKP
jgi:SAM-dependent methyltransferase